MTFFTLLFEEDADEELELEQNSNSACKSTVEPTIAEILLHLQFRSPIFVVSENVKNSTEATMVPEILALTSILLHRLPKSYSSDIQIY